MQKPAGGLHAPDHAKVILKAVQPRKQHHTCFVILGRGLEDSARQRDRGVEDGVIAARIPVSEPVERSGRSRRDRVKNAEKAMRNVASIALDQVGVVEVIAGVHLHPGW